MTLTADEVRARLAQLRERDLPTHGGRTLAYVYDSGLAEVDAIAKEAVAAYAGTNGLDPSVFPSVATMERDVVGFAARVLAAPEGYAGTVTSGGTESCLLAVLAASPAAAFTEPDQGAWLSLSAGLGATHPPVALGPSWQVGAGIWLGKHDDAYYIAMEYVSGKDLRALLERFRRRREIMPTAMAVFVASKIGTTTSI